jgi:hypothetical protein
LPTKEESERQFKQDAAEKAAELRQQEELRAAELQSARYRERAKFHEELRTILQGQPDLLGAEIDKLVARYNYDGDPDRVKQAAEIWRRPRPSTAAAKAKLIRDLEMPESLILNFLSDDVYRRSRTRNGPRGKDQIRVVAAQQLLHIGLPSEEEMRPPRQQPNLGAARSARYNVVPSADRQVQRRR